jgi:hypothetical protein
MTLSQRNTINSPAAGLQIWCTDCNSNGEFQVFNGLSWTNSLGINSNLTVPDSPVNVQVVQNGNDQISIAFATPISNGGSTITSYTVSVFPGNTSFTSTTSPIVISGLTEGTSYTFSVVATNAIGNSVPVTSSITMSGNFYWSSNGNSDTASSNFIGTTDVQSLLFKTNNTERLTFNSNGSIDLHGNSIQGFNYVIDYKTNSYTLLTSDCGKTLIFDSLNTIVLTVPNGLPVGFTISILQKGIGQVVFTSASGVELNNRGGYYSTIDTFSVASLINYASNTYVLTGDLD